MINIIDLIESNPKKQAYNYTITGTIIDEVIPPHPIPTLYLIEQDTCFALMDVIAITGNGNKPMWTRGYILVVVPRELVREAKRKPSGRLAVAITGGRLQYALKDDSIVSMYQFKSLMVGDKKVWGLEPLKIRALTKHQDGEIIKALSYANNNNWTYMLPEPTPNGFRVCTDNVALQTPSGYFLKGGFYSNKPLVPPIDGSSALQYAVEEESVQSEGYINKPQPTYTPPDYGQQQDYNTTTEQQDMFKGDDSLLPEVGGLFSDGFGLGKTTTNTFGVVDKGTPTTNGSRFEPVPIKNEIKIIEQQLKEGIDKHGIIISSLREEPKHNKVLDMMLKNLEEGFRNNWAREIMGVTGRELFENILNKLEIKPRDGEMTTKECLNLRYSDAIKSLNTIVEGYPISTQINGNREIILFAVLETALKISNDRYTNTYQLFVNNGLNFFDTIKNSPFTLSYINNSITLEDIEKLRRLFNIEVQQEGKNMRDVAFLRSIMLNPNNHIINGSTVVNEYKLKKALVSGITLSKQTAPLVRSYNRYIGDEQEEFIQAYIHKVITKEFFDIKEERVELKGNDYIIADGRPVEKVIENYILSGQGVRLSIHGKSYIADTTLLTKEIELIKKFDKMNKITRTKIAQDRLDECVKDFETMKTKELGFEFKLEEEQKNILKILHYRALVLTGCAGSGKTTVAELLLFALKRFYGLDEDSIVFVAPTGKAAVRLKETVKAKTSTIHSEFNVGIGMKPLIDWEKDIEERDTEAMLGDEYSMVDINVAYASLMQLNNDCTNIFLGDINQLPPIGFGKPLSDFLQYLPCVKLNVSKRAKEGSMITVNAERTFNKNNKEEWTEGKDFIIENTTDVTHAINHMKKIIKHHILGQQTDARVSKELGVINVDDFQVITPYSNSGNYNTKVLNREIQDIVNPYTTKSIYFTMNKEDYEFRIGDRVMHTSSNLKEEPHFKLTNVPNKLDTLDGIGVFNGDVGKIKGFYNTKALSDAGLKDYFSSYGDNGEDIPSDYITIGVEYESLNEDNKLEKYLVLYTTRVVTDNGRHFVCSIGQLKNLQLAYASTVHKLQGSQSLLTISLLPAKKITSFISYNMVYTGITRTQKVAYYIGSVYGKDSAVNQARKVNALDKRDTLVSILYD